MSDDADLIIAGGGLAGGLIALRLAQTRPEVRVLLVEQGPTLGGRHTWSSFETDLKPASRAWTDRLIAHRWQGYEVRFPAHHRTLQAAYRSVTSERFHAELSAQLGPAVLTNAPIAEVAPDGVRLADGRRFKAPGVIDARGQAGGEKGTGAAPHLILAWQKFLGVEAITGQPHGLTRPIVMDATVPQEDGYRFVYVLPLAPDRLLIEDTFYSDGADLDVARLRTNIERYAAAQGWSLARVARTEQGVLPIALEGDIQAFLAAGERETPVARAGLRAGLFHPLTGYSFPDAVGLAERVAAARDLRSPSLLALTRAHAIKTWEARSYYRLLSRLLFRAAAPEQRFRVMQRFYRLPEPLVERLYAAHLTPADKLRILTGKPPVPILAALRQLRKETPAP